MLSTAMRVACLDLEGVLIPEIWQNVARRTGIEELMLTTRDIPDYDQLMRRRLAILEEHRVTLDDIRSVIRAMEPLEGAKGFVDTIREMMQLVILSDTFAEFAGPLMRHLGYPTLFCNSLSIDARGRVTDYHLRQANGKREAVCAFHSMKLEVFAAGDSYNDLAMIREADAGALFRPPESIVTENPDLTVCSGYDELLAFLSSDSAGSSPSADAAISEATPRS